MKHNKGKKFQCDGAYNLQVKKHIKSSSVAHNTNWKGKAKQIFLENIIKKKIVYKIQASK